MGDYPRKLIRVSDTAFGSLLSLSDGREIPINISADRLNQAFVDYERPPLSELVTSQLLSVYAGTWETTTEEWDHLRTIVLASSVAVTKFGGVPSIWSVFEQTEMFLRELPQRVYGGLEQALYTSHPFSFRRDPNRPAPWVRSLLRTSGGWLFNTWVHLESGQVEVESDILLGHFIE